MKKTKKSGTTPAKRICPYAQSGYPQRITFIRKKEDPIEDIFSIYYIVCGLYYLHIHQKGKRKPLQRNVTLKYMWQRLPPCLFFYCGKRTMVNMSRVKSCCWVGRRIKLVLIKDKVLYVSRMRTIFFLALITLYPNIKGIETLILESRCRK